MKLRSTADAVPLFRARARIHSTTPGSHHLSLLSLDAGAMIDDGLIDLLFFAFGFVSYVIALYVVYIYSLLVYWLSLFAIFAIVDTALVTHHDRRTLHFAISPSTRAFWPAQRMTQASPIRARC